MELLGMLTIFLLFCISWFIFLAAWSRKTGNRNLPPGPFPLPILGNVLQLTAKNLPGKFRKLSEKYGPVFTMYFGAERVVVLHGYDVIKEALIDRADEFAARGSLPLANSIREGLGIIFSNGEKWKQLRRFALTTLRDFGMGKKSIEERIQEEAQYLLEALRDTKGKPFDPTCLLGCAFSNVICSIVFRNRYEYNDKNFLALIASLNDNFQIFSSWQGQLYNSFPSFMAAVPGPHQRLQRNMLTMKEFVLEQIKVHKATLDLSEPQDFIDSFHVKMDQEKDNDVSEFNLNNLVYSTMDLFGAGTETSNTTLRYGLLILMKHPEIEEKVQKEIDRVIGQTRSPCMADRGQMPYTDAVLHEIQRFISLIPLNIPRAVERDTPFRQYIIPKGTTIYPVLQSVLYDSKEFPNPEKFDPQHFLHKDGTFRKSNFFMPFSAGKRICIGEGLARMELFLFLTTILQNFSLKPLGHPKDLDLTPQLSSFGNLPQFFQLCVIPR